MGGIWTKNIFYPSLVHREKDYSADIFHIPYSICNTAPVQGRYHATCGSHGTLQELTLFATGQLLYASESTDVVFIPPLKVEPFWA